MSSSMYTEITITRMSENSSFSVPSAAPSTKLISVELYFSTSFALMLLTKSSPCLRDLDPPHSVMVEPELEPVDVQLGLGAGWVSVVDRKVGVDPI